jgi:hypothetical protein
MISELPISSNYNRKQTDEILLALFFALKNGFEECKPYGGDYLNLVGVFFHEFMFFLSSSIYQSILKDTGKGEFDIKSSQVVINEIPHLGYRKFKGYDSIQKPTIPYKKKVFSIISQIYGLKEPKICITNPNLNVPWIATQMLKNRIRFTFPNQIHLDLPQQHQQLAVVRDLLQEIYQKFPVSGNHEEMMGIIKNTLELLRTPLSFSPKHSLLLTGTLAKLNNRILAANAMSQEIPVVCVAHSNESGAADLLPDGWNDRSYCSHLIGYGPGGCLEKNGGTFHKSLSGKQPEYIETTADSLKDFYHSGNILPLELTDTSKILYVTNRFFGSISIGPFNSIPDEHYKNWQEYLISQFPNLFYKRHPKKQIEHDIAGLLPGKIIGGFLEDCIQEYDLFFIDHVASTAIVNIAASNKPIIYFNIGFGKLTPEAEKRLRKRVVWLDIDYRQPGDIKKMISNSHSFKATNTYTPFFCMSKKQESREEITLNTIKGLL